VLVSRLLAVPLLVGPVKRIHDLAGRVPVLLERKGGRIKDVALMIGLES
jgi:hypothetical protein